MRTSISVSDYHTGIGHRNANLLLVNQIFQFWDVNYHTVTHYIQKPTVFCSHILPSGYQTWQRGNHQFIDDFVPARKLHFKQRSSIAFDFPKALSQDHPRRVPTVESMGIHWAEPLEAPEATILDDYVINCIQLLCHHTYFLYDSYLCISTSLGSFSKCMAYNRYNSYNPSFFVVD